MEKLQRQRALLHEHLRWLESEIAAEASSTPTSQPASQVPAAPLAAPSSPAPIPPGSIAPAAAVEVPEADVRGIHSEVRSGCLLYFALAFVALGLVVGFIYWRY